MRWMALAALLAPRVATAQALERFEFSEPHMGTEFRVVVYAEDRAAVDSVVTEAFRRAALMDSLFSDYRDDSEIAELARRAGSGDTLWVHRETHQLLMASLFYARVTDGAFNPAVGPLTRLWRWSSRRGELPDSARVSVARSKIDYGAIRFADPGGVLLGVPGMALDLGGIAKGFAADEMRFVIGRAGFDRVLVDAGGDISVGRAPPGEGGWSIITPSGAVVELEYQGVATSGDTHRFVEIDGVRYSHIVDPGTGLGVVDAEPVTIVATDGTTADALASALSVMDREAGDRLLAFFEGEARRIEPKGAH